MPRSNLISPPPCTCRVSYVVFTHDVNKLAGCQSKHSFDYSTQQLAYEELRCCGGVKLKAVAKEGGWLIAVVSNNNMFHV
jgi:hypothetical protein